MNKRVAFFIDSLAGGGAERVVSLLSSEFIKKNYSVDIVMLRKRSIAYPLSGEVNILYSEDMPIDSWWGKIVHRCFETHTKLRRRVYVPIARRLGFGDRLPRRDETGFFFYARYGMPYREYLKQHEGAIAFGFLIRSNIALAMAAKGQRVKIVFCERNNPIRPDVPKNIIRLRNRLYSRFSCGVFQTEEQKQYYKKLSGKKYVIPNPVKCDLPEPHTGERRHEIVNFCRLTPQKNLKLLIDAFGLLLRDFPDYTLRIYGKGDIKEELQEYIREHGLAGRAYIEDFVPDVHEQIKDAAMFVSTSDFEGISNSMIEAMALGLPCVCTDCDGGGARMMIRNGENGLLVPKGDLDAVVAAMRRILEDMGCAEKLSRNAAKIREELSVERITDMWMQLM